MNIHTLFHQIHITDINVATALVKEVSFKADLFMEAFIVCTQFNDMNDTIVSSDFLWNKTREIQCLTHAAHQ